MTRRSSQYLTFYMSHNLLTKIRKSLKLLAGKITKRARVILLLAFVASLVVFGLSLVRLFNVLAFEDYVESRSIERMKSHISTARFDSRKIKIIVIPDTQRGDGPWGDLKKEHRKFFVDLVDAMRTARAKVLAFDVAFEGPFEKDFSNAISSQSDHPKVIVGIDSYENGKADPELPTDVKEPHWGIVNVGGSQVVEGPIRSMKLAEESSKNNSSGRSELIVCPSFAVRVVSEFSDPPLVPEFDHGNQRLFLYSDSSKSKIVKSIPLDREQDLLLQQASQQDLDTARVYAQDIYDKLKNQEPLRKQDYEDKIVLVGYENGDLKDVLSGGKRFGVQIQATAISNILNEVFIYKLPPLYNYLIILLMALVAAALYTPLGECLRFSIPVPVPWTKLVIPIPVSLIVLAVIYLLTAFIVYRSSRVYLDVCYHIAALGISYALIWLVLRKKFPPEVLPQPDWEGVS